MDTETTLLWEQLEQILRTWKGKPPTQIELADQIRPPHRNNFYAWLEQQRVQGLVVRTRKDGWVLLEQSGMAVGRLQRNPRGFAFLVQDDPNLDDIFIPPNAMGSALHGDRVLATLQPGRRGDRTEGMVYDVLARARTRVVGVYEPQARAASSSPTTSIWAPMYGSFPAARARPAAA
jgi:ribonuclease R